MEARDERRLLRLQKQMAGYKLLIIDEVGFVSLNKTGAELLFEMISHRCERSASRSTRVLCPGNDRAAVPNVPAAKSRPGSASSMTCAGPACDQRRMKNRVAR